MVEAARESKLGYRVLIKPAQVSETSAAGVILMPNQNERDMQEANNDIGVIIEIGETAFNHERYGWKDPLAQAFIEYNARVHGIPKPDPLKEAFKVGDTVRFKPHSGYLFKYKNESGTPEGDYYQIVNDNDILSQTEVSHGG